MGRRKASDRSAEELTPLVIADYLSGMSRRGLAEKYDRSVWTITHWLRSAQVDLRDPQEESRRHRSDTRKIDIDKDQLHDLYINQLWSVGRIALAMGVDRSVIADRVRLYGFVRTPEQETRARAETRNARKRTCRQRFGGDSPNADPGIRARTADTNQERYGHPNPFGSAEVREQIRQTNLEKYGVENPLQDPQRAAQTGVSVSAAAQGKWSVLARTSLASRESLYAYMHRSGRRTVPLLREALGVSDDTIYARLTAFGLWEELDTAYHTSAWERGVGDALRSWGIPVEKARGLLPGPAGRGMDIDWYSPEHRIGVECNGSYHHSEARRGDRRYHLKKTQAAIDQGIFLYHIFSYEWANPRTRPIIESQLRNRFGLVERRIGARTCEIAEVPPSDASVFLEENHLQGRVGAPVRYGLIRDGELVALMTFGPVREQRREAVQWELIRYAVLRNTAVPGGAERLFRHFLRMHQPQSIVSYSDIAKTTGEMYPRLGFSLAGQSAPEYVWWKNESTVLRRYQCMKHKLVKTHADRIPDIESLSESEIMHIRGYWRIWGCGNKVWIWGL